MSDYVEMLGRSNLTEDECKEMDSRNVLGMMMQGGGGTGNSWLRGNAVLAAFGRQFTYESPGVARAPVPAGTSVVSTEANFLANLQMMVNVLDLQARQYKVVLPIAQTIQSLHSLILQRYQVLAGTARR